jgi:hypothetical protein
MSHLRCTALRTLRSRRGALYRLRVQILRWVKLSWIQVRSAARSTRSQREFPYDNLIDIEVWCRPRHVRHHSGRQILGETRSLLVQGIHAGDSHSLTVGICLVLRAMYYILSCRGFELLECSVELRNGIEAKVLIYVLHLSRSNQSLLETNQNALVVVFVPRAILSGVDLDNNARWYRAAVLDSNRH